MTKALPRSGEAGTDAVSTASGQITKAAGLVTPARSGAGVYRVVPAHLACRVGARPRAGERNACSRWSRSRWGRSRWCSPR
jgi:hypothetical protein